MPLPMSLAAFRIFVPGSVLARKAIDQDIIPTIAVEIVGESYESVGIGVVHSQAAFETGNGLFRAIAFLQLKSRVGAIDFMARLEFRPFIPEGAGDDVHPS